ncbi:MAG: undecaprenyldiphospho-muramoylpentapeptide beta-N-acetylglucosaminyltransferase [Oscillospiraceae bacterium]|nr:undecaprenyldiphospho-muramoylpentapeptide beta-N-acetylglucosaminyltransferase [Oscillospiraceae bacterium]
MKILIAAGGTGGHINPALAAATALRSLQADVEILFVGARGKMEERLVPQAGFALRLVDSAGFYRALTPKAMAHNVQSAALLLKSTGQVRGILHEWKPDVVAGFGGYVTGAVLRVAQSRGIPTVIHEQNAFPGITNKALARRADAVLLTSEKAAQFLRTRVQPRVTGLPVRAELPAANKQESRFMLGLDDRPFLLSMGGSLGAQPINEAMLDVVAAHAKSADCHIMHAAGTETAAQSFRDALAARGVELSHARHITIRPYITDMARCLSAADLVVCRAGASSLAEFQACGKPSILIPSPYVAENHQFHNAQALVERGAAQLIEEKDLADDRLTRSVKALLFDSARLAEMGAAAKAMAHPGAAESIAKAILGVGNLASSL